MRQVPILFLSDAVDQHTGLARITRDLCVLLSSQPEWRVGSLGLGGMGTRHLPWQQYQLGRYPDGSYEYGELTLPQVWDDFAGAEQGIVFTIFDLSRLLWLARPEFCQDDTLKDWLEHARMRRFKLWSYLPIDATGPGDRLTTMARDTLMGIDRVLAYTPWARDVVARTIGPDASTAKGLDWLPHGLNLDVFTPARPKYTTMRVVEGKLEPVPEAEIGELTDMAAWIGVVATNQARKDWGLMAAVCAELAKRFDDKVRFWWHIDTDVRYWSIPALLADYGLHVDVTHPPMSDRELASWYRKCALTLHPGLGEGFGFPIFESLACGTPVLHGDYAGGASILNTCGFSCIPAVAWRSEGQHNSLRPVFDLSHWVMHAQALLEAETIAPCRSRVEHLHWTKLGPRWRRWFRDGIVEVSNG